MKNVTLFILSSLILLLASCQKTECGFGNEIVGKWQLTEQLADPGDGSGTFNPITSSKEIRFYANGTFEANGDMCQMTSQAGLIHTGTYDISNETLAPDNCVSMMPMSYNYTLNGNTLIISFPCICGCQQKYERI
ncbi:MAG: lipocalin family protein [Crocinitomicaceae bacterium]|nr:lipocalin family protein [Crocinitomicaceae bacterium]